MTKFFSHKFIKDSRCGLGVACVTFLTLMNLQTQPETDKMSEILTNEIFMVYDNDVSCTIPAAGRSQTQPSLSLRHTEASFTKGSVLFNAFAGVERLAGGAENN